jgi:hypothetical protein
VGDVLQALSEVIRVAAAVRWQLGLATRGGGADAWGAGRRSGASAPAAL